MFGKTIGILLVLAIYFHITYSKKNQSKLLFQFEDFTKKFDPSYIWEQIDKRSKVGANLSNVNHAETMMRCIDPTEELLKFKVENGNADILALEDGRRHRDEGWLAPKGTVFSAADPFSVRRRLLELMKQAIYQTRNKLVIMQTLRGKYKKSPLYKMGFLMSKTDTNCKIFTLFSFRAFRLCMIRRQHMVYRYVLYDALQSNERQLQHWFNIELLVDLIEQNDFNSRKVIREHLADRKKYWKFVN